MITAVSAETAKAAKEYGLKPEEMALVDLVAAGWDSRDAYALTVRTGAVTWTKKALKQEIDRILALPGAVERTAGGKGKPQGGAEQDAAGMTRAEILQKATSKEDKLVELQLTLDTLKPASPEWVKVNQMIIDVSKMKQDEVKTDDNTIHYYLPVNYPTSCEDCLVAKNREGEL